MGVSSQAMLGLLVGLLLCVALSHGARNDNRHAFEVLCNLYQLAGAPIKMPDGALKESIRDDLIKLNMTTADDDWYNLFDVKDPETWDGAKKLDKFKAFEKDTDWSQKYTEWLKAKKELVEDAKERKEYHRPPPTRQRKIAHFRIRRLWQLFEEEERERQNLDGNLKKLETDIEKKFNASRFGAEDAKEVTAASLDKGGSALRSANAICGGNLGTAETGTSLANDIACICTGEHSADSNNVCDNTYTDGNSKTWNSGGAATLIDEIKKIVKLCPKNPDKFQVTAGAVRERIAKFWGALGKTQQGTRTLNTNYVLGGAGAGSADGDCTGATSSGTKICINYRANLKGTASADPSGIPWLIKMEAAAGLLDELAVEGNKIHTLNARAESLRDAAWAAYEEARLPDPSGNGAELAPTAAKKDKPATVTPGPDGKTEEKSGTTVPRLILPWAPLI